MSATSSPSGLEPNPSNINLNNAFSYIIEKNNKNHKELESDISFIMIISVAILIVLLFFISYKVFVFMDINNVNNVDIGIFPYNNNPDSDGYDMNYLAEQSYYKSLSDVDKDSYLSLQDFEKDNAIKKYLVSQIVI